MVLTNLNEWRQLLLAKISFNYSKFTEISEIVLFQTSQKLWKNDVKLELQKLRKTCSNSKVWLKVWNTGPYPLSYLSSCWCTMGIRIVKIFTQRKDNQMTITNYITLSPLLFHISSSQNRCSMHLLMTEMSFMGHPQFRPI